MRNICITYAANASVKCQVLSVKSMRLEMSIVQNVPNHSGIRFHRGTKPEHSTGCILVVADNKQKGTINNNTNVREAIVRPKGDKNINLNYNNTNNINQQLLRSTPNCHEQFRGPRSSQQHSERSREDVPQPRGCGLISPDSSNDRSAYVPQRNVVENNVVDVVVNPTPVVNSSPVTCRSAAEIERSA